MNCGMDFKMNKMLLTLPILALSLSACSDLQTKEQLSTLTIENFASKACEEMLDANFEQLEVMLNKNDLKKLKKEVGDNPDSWATLSDRMSCEVKKSVPKKERTKFYFERGVFNMDIEKVDGSYFVVDVD
ncbi:MAG: hypothetical protein ACJAUK_001124 [Colwellia polaris]|jgi:hypothetical protein